MTRLFLKELMMTKEDKAKEISIKKNLLGQWCFVDGNGNTAKLYDAKGKVKTQWYSKHALRLESSEMKGFNVDECNNFYRKKLVITALSLKTIRQSIAELQNKNLPDLKNSMEKLEKYKKTIAYSFCPEEFPILMKIMSDILNRSQSNSEEKIDEFLTAYIHDLLDLQCYLLDKNIGFADNMKTSSDVWNNKEKTKLLYGEEYIKYTDDNVNNL